MRNSSCAFLVVLWAGMLACPAADRDAEPDPTRWEKDIAAFEAMDRTNPPPKGAVLFVGSSSIRFWTNIANDFPGLTVIRRGFGGSHIPDLTHFAERIIIPYAPSKIVIYGGDNDIARGHSPKRVYEDFRDLARKLHAALPKADIYFLAIKPSPSRWHLSPQSEKANRLIRRYCWTHRKIEFIDVWKPLLGPGGRPDPALFEEDSLHINQLGYARWAEVIRKALQD